MDSLISSFYILKLICDFKSVTLIIIYCASDLSPVKEQTVRKRDREIIFI